LEQASNIISGSKARQQQQRSKIIRSQAIAEQTSHSGRSVCNIVCNIRRGATARSATKTMGQPSLASAIVIHNSHFSGTSVG
jgi:hypothetical protein